MSVEVSVGRGGRRRRHRRPDRAAAPGRHRACTRPRSGGGSVAAYDSARDAASTDQLALLAELREALARRRPAGAGAAAGGRPGHRRADRGGGADPLAAPAPRLALARPTSSARWRTASCSAPFTRYVLDKALAVAAEWARGGPGRADLGQPVGPQPARPAAAGGRSREALRRHQVPPRRLVLEITETVVMSELEVIDEVLATLRAMGVQLAVDDFGTGFSSLTFLTRIAVDELKVDRSFVIRMADSPEAAAIVRTTVELGPRAGRCGWWPRAWRPPSSGPRWPRWAAPPPRATTSSSRCRPTRSARCCGSLLDAAQANVFPLRADGAS